MILSRFQLPSEMFRDRQRADGGWDVAIDPLDLRDRFEGVLPRSSVSTGWQPTAAADTADGKRADCGPETRAAARNRQLQTSVPPRLLLVEDECDLRYYYASELEEEGYQVLEAWDERSAQVYLCLGLVDLVVLDINLGGVSSLGLLQTISDQMPRPPVVICTAYPQYRYTDAAWPADAFVTKSIDLVELKQEIRRLLNGVRSH